MHTTPGTEASLCRNEDGNNYCCGNNKMQRCDSRHTIHTPPPEHRERDHVEEAKSRSLHEEYSTDSH